MPAPSCWQSNSFRFCEGCSFKLHLHASWPTAGNCAQTRSPLSAEHNQAHPCSSKSNSTAARHLLFYAGSRARGSLPPMNGGRARGTWRLMGRPWQRSALSPELALFCSALACLYVAGRSVSSHAPLGPSFLDRQCKHQPVVARNLAGGVAATDTRTGMHAGCGRRRERCIIW